MATDIDFDRQPDYDGVVDVLIEKTKAGRLLWEETAFEGTYVCHIKGRQDIEVSQVHDAVILTVREPEGNVLYDARHEADAPDSPWRELYLLAQRIATGVDARIDSTKGLLGDL